MRTYFIQARSNGGKRGAGGSQHRLSGDSVHPQQLARIAAWHPQRNPVEHIWNLLIFAPFTAHVTLDGLGQEQAWCV